MPPSLPGTTFLSRTIRHLPLGAPIRRRELLPLVTETIGHLYTVEREIARGGASRVFRARDSAGNSVALKVLRPELAVTVTADRFLREIQLLKEFDHPNIARLIDSGESDYLIYYVMPFVEGPTLRDHLSRVRRAGLDDTMRIGHDLLGALAYAHERNIVHRDVKPENIVLARGGPVLVDFGIARAVAASGLDKLTRSGFSVGTSAYMSPEQVSGADDLDARSDIYSLGCVLFECLAGRPPFTGKNEQLVLRMHLEADAPDILEFCPDLDPQFAAVINRALASKREDRWQTARAMQEAVAQLAGRG